MSEENQEQTQQATDPASATRDDLIAAVREAGGTESVDVAGEEQAAKEAPTAPAEAAPAAEDEEPKILAAIRAREKATAEREAARNQAQEMIEEARRQAEQLREETRRQLQQEMEAERQRMRAEFRANPIGTIRALGDPQEISDAIMREGTPEARAMREMQAKLEEANKKAGIAEDVKKQFEDFKQAQEQARQAQVVEQVRQQFLQHTTKETTPYLNARYEPEQIFAEGNRVASMWRNGGMNLVPVGAPKGETDFDFTDVAKYLDLEAKKRFAASGLTPAQQASAAAAATPQGNAPKVPANGPRTLSAAQGSERRTSPKPLHELPPDKQREELMAEVAAARRANPDAPF